MRNITEYLKKRFFITFGFFIKTLIAIGMIIIAAPYYTFLILIKLLWVISLIVSYIVSFLGQIFAYCLYQSNIKIGKSRFIDSTNSIHLAGKFVFDMSRLKENSYKERFEDLLSDIETSGILNKVDSVNVRTHGSMFGILDQTNKDGYAAPILECFKVEERKIYFIRKYTYFMFKLPNLRLSKVISINSLMKILSTREFEITIDQAAIEKYNSIIRAKC